jgi:STE24 endopeptidase
MNIYLIIILTALIGEFVIQSMVSLLNLRMLNTTLPDEFKSFYEEGKYKKAQEYTIAQTKFDFVMSTFNLILIISFILPGGFNYVDKFARGFNLGTVMTGLIFFGVLYFSFSFISIPFSLYSDFVIEEKFGFNKMSIKTFILDTLKGYFLAIVIGSIVLGGLLFFFEKAGVYAWLYAWALVSFVTLIAQPLYTIVIAPMFNTFTPLENGKLKEDIEQYGRRVKFPLKEICMMDGSKRSAHSNAYFSGILKKRIALFDTLLQKHTPEEIVAIIAHEVGHYMKHHIIKGMALSILHSGILLFFLSLFVKNQGLAHAFRMEQTSVYAGFVFFGLLYSPIILLLSILRNYISRKHEFEADTFAAETIGSPEALILSLKNLSIANYSNLTPHPWNVVLNYSHPPVMERIKALRSLPLPIKD